MPKTAPTAREERTNSVRSPAPRKSSGGGGVWSLLGFLCLIGGLGLALGPKASWKAMQVAQLLDQIGLQAGSVAIGGLVLIGIGSLRGMIESVRQAARNEEDTLLLEQVARDLIQLNESVDEVQSRAEQVGQELAAVKVQVMKEPPPPPPPPPAPDTSMHSDALFRLATSLDKLHARLDERLGLHHASLAANVEQLRATLEEMRQSLQHGASHEHGVASHGVASHGAAEHGVASHGAPTDHAEVCDELATSVPGQARSLGLLDALDDECVPAALPARPQEAASPNANTSASSDTKPGSWDEQLMVERAAQGDLTQTKLAQLQALLSDERLRNALQNISKLAR